VDAAKTSACACCEARANSVSDHARICGRKVEAARRRADIVRSRGLAPPACESAAFGMNLHHAREVNRADDIDIMQNKRLVKTVGILKEK